MPVPIVPKPTPFLDFMRGSGGQFVGNTLSDLGAGLLSAPNWQQGLANAGRMTQAQQPYRAEQADRQASLAEQQEQQNQTVAWLQERGYDDLVAAVTGGGLDISAAWSEGLRRANPEPVQRRIVTGPDGRPYYEDGTPILPGVEPRASEGPTYFGTPVITQDEAGNLYGNQLSSAGGVLPFNLPDGQRLAPPTYSRETPTEVIVYNQQGQVISREPKDNRTAERDKELGAGEGASLIEILNTAPNNIVRAETMMSTLDSILNDPKLPGVLGIWGLFEEPLPGTEEFRVWSNIRALEGQAFLQAFDQLRGAGAITQIESEQAKQASLNFNRKMRPEDYRAALEQLRTIVQRALERQRAKLQQADSFANPGGAGPLSPPTAAPPADGVVDYTNYTGGR